MVVLNTSQGVPMRWLRTQRDMIGLIAVWGILLQSLAIPFSTGLHAATLASGDGAAGGADFALLCTTRGTISSKVAGIAPDGQTENRNGAGCPCSMACHAGCASACGGGVLPGFARVALPGDAILATSSSLHAQVAGTKLLHLKEPRAPPASS